MKEKLQQQKPELYKEFSNVWDIKRRHEVPHLPPEYLYLLVCCFKPMCRHPPSGQGINSHGGGPKLDFIPLPAPDPPQPWGGDHCQSLLET